MNDMTSGSWPPAFGTSELLVPFECTRCGAVKRDATGHVERVTITEWERYQPQLCPPCYQTVQALQRLTELVLREDDDEM